MHIYSWCCVLCWVHVDGESESRQRHLLSADCWGQPLKQCWWRLWHWNDVSCTRWRSTRSRCLYISLSLCISFLSRPYGSTVEIWLNFITQVQKLGSIPPKKFRGSKTCKILVDFGPLQNLIANISGTGQHIQTRVTNYGISSCVWWKSPVNFGPLTGWNYMWVCTH